MNEPGDTPADGQPGEPDGTPGPDGTQGPDGTPPGGHEPPSYGQPGPYGTPPGGTPPPNPYGSPYGAQPGDPYGAQPPGGGFGPPPPGPYDPYGAAQPLGPTPYSITAAIGYGWRKFTENAGLFILVMVLWFVVSGVVSFTVGLVTGTGLDLSASGQDPSWSVNPLGGGNFLGSATESLVTSIIGFFVQALVTKAALDITHGRRPSLDTMADGLNWGQLAIAAILLSVATTIGYLLCFLPGLVVWLLTMFTFHFIIDQRLDAIEAIKASLRLVADNLGNTIGFALLCLVVVVAGFLACCVGLLAALPVVFIGTAYTYRSLRGEQPV